MPRRNGFAGSGHLFPGSDFTAEEWAFIQGMAAYQKRWNRRYPSWREVLHVLTCLGYRKVAPEVPVDDAPPTVAERELLAAAKKNELPPDKSA